MPEEPVGDGSVGDLAGVIAVGAGTSFAGKILGLGLQYVSQLLLAWLLGPARFGLYALGLGVHQMVALVAKLGLGTGGTRFIAVYRQRPDPGPLKGVLLSVGSLPFILGAVLAVPLIVGADLLATRVFDEPSLAPALRVFAVAIPFAASMQAVAQSTTAFGVTGPMVSILYLIHPGANLLLIGVLGALGLGIFEASFAWLAATALACAAAWRYARNLYRATVQTRVRAAYEPGPLLRFSLPLVIGDFLWVAMLWVDVLMLGLFTGAAEVGVYRAASQMAILLTVVPFAVDSIFGPMIAALHESGKRNRMREIFQVSTRWSLAASLPLFAALAIASREALRLYGPEFPAGATALVILISGQLVSCATGGVGSLLIMTGHQYQKLVGDAAVMVLNVLLNLYLIPRFGLVGAALATSISISGMNVLWLIQAKLFLGMQPFTLGFLKPILAGAGAGVAGWVAHRLIESLHFLAGLALTGAVVGLVFIALVLAMGLDPLDRKLFTDWLSGVSRKARPQSTS